MHELGPHPHEEALRSYAKGFPGAVEEWPWGHAAIKVRGKIFVMIVWNAQGLKVSAKLPETCEEALLLPFATPTAYGLGKHGWVTGALGPDESPPLPVFRRWIDESYRAVAPKALLRELDNDPPAGAQRRRKA